MKNQPRVVHRVVANNMTLSIFETFNYDTVLVTIPLRDLLIENDEVDNDCVVVQNKGNPDKYTMCTM